MMQTAQTIQDIIEKVATFTNDDAPKITRLVYQESWVQAQDYLLTLGQSLGMNVAIDEMGNGILTVKGTEEGVVTLGSHLDSVVDAGKYDGVYGIAAAIIAVKELVDSYGTPKQDMQIFLFSEEEGSRFPMNFSGSRFIIDDLPEMEQLKDGDGAFFMAERKKALDVLKAKFPVGQAQQPISFAEIHIEQGPVLERKNKQIGLVTGIVAQKKFTVTVNGEANHAGTTPMSMRKDALKQALQLIGYLEEVAQTIGEPFVYTVGEMKVSPNVTNVVPRQAVFSIDIRHLDAHQLDVFEEKMHAYIQKKEAQTGMTMSVECWLNEPSERMDTEFLTLLETICKEKKLTYEKMPSGAGHDTQIMNLVTRTALLFVPSHNGISHSPYEYTASEDLENGKEVLKELIHRLAY